MSSDSNGLPRLTTTYTRTIALACAWWKMRNEHHDTDTSATIKQVTEEIYQLAEEQTKALKQPFLA